jgi:hypothetical protein
VRTEVVDVLAVVVADARHVATEALACVGDEVDVAG